MDTLEKDIQHYLNSIMEQIECHDDVYSPKIEVTYLIRDSDKKREMKYSLDVDVFHYRITAQKYKDTLTKKL